jgi:hypothetical protein
MNPVPNSVDMAKQGSESLQYQLSVLCIGMRTEQTEQLIHDIEQLMRDIGQSPAGRGPALGENLRSAWEHVEHWDHWGLNE